MYASAAGMLTGIARQDLYAAISGPGGLTVQTRQGVRYTRDGRLQVKTAGRLVDAVAGVNGLTELGIAAGTPAPRGDAVSRGPGVTGGTATVPHPPAPLPHLENGPGSASSRIPVVCSGRM
jgi:hypothetical protein